MDDFIYRASALLLLVLALGGLFLLAEIGHWFGRRSRPADPEHLRVQVGGIQGALLGLLALLLGFTFSMALDRFETRKNLVVEEANAIGTAALRARFLPAAERTEAMDLFRHYVAIRLDLGSRPNLPGSNREELNAATTRIQDRLWGMAAAALDADSRSEGAGLFAAAMNAMIDVKGENDAALANPFHRAC